LRRPGSPFVNAHNILALAGAGDADSIDKWIEHKTQTGESHSEAPVIRIARGLRAYITGSYAHAAQELHGIAAQFSKIGGSRAQNELFSRLQESACRKAGGTRSDYACAA